VSLFVVVGGIVAARVFSLEQHGVALLGTVPQGLPMPAVPLVSRADIHEVFPLAMACFVLAAVETSAIGRMFGSKHGYRLDATQEFLAIGSANLMSGFGSGFPVSGGMSQSLVNEGGGARTPLSGALAAGIILVVVLFFSHLLSALPQPVLAAVVLVAVLQAADGTDVAASFSGSFWIAKEVDDPQRYQRQCERQQPNRPRAARQLPRPAR